MTTPQLEESTMAPTHPTSVVWDDEQPVDHAGTPVAPLTPAGMPYRWRLRLPGRSLYAVDADQILAAVIDDYPTPPPGNSSADWDHFEEASHDVRTLHAFGVIVDHVAQAMFAGQLDPTAERTLQRSANRGADWPPITATDCPEWTNAVPMILIKDLYNPEVTPRQPPQGNVIYIDPGLAEAYLLDLARLGVVDLETNPAYRGIDTSEISVSTRHDPTSQFGSS